MSLDILLNKPIEFRDGEKVHTVSRLTKDKKAEFSAWVRANARETLFDLKPHLSPEDWAREYSDYKTTATTGGYGFHSPLCLEALGTVEGSITLAAILFGCDRETMLDLFARRGDEIKLLMDEIREESKTPEKNEQAGKAITPTPT